MLTAIQKKHWHMCSVTHTHRLLPSHAFVLTESIFLSPHLLFPSRPNTPDCQLQTTLTYHPITSTNDIPRGQIQQASEPC